MSSERRESKYKAILFVISLVIIFIGAAINSQNVTVWAGQVMTVLAAAYIGIYAADHLSKQAEERARDLFSALSRDSIKKMINDAISFIAIPRGHGDPYPPGMQLFIYYVSGNRKNPRYWQLSVVTVGFRVSAGTWIGDSTIKDSDDHDCDYTMEVRTVRDMLVVASSQDPAQRERSAIYVFDSKMPDSRVFGILSHIDWCGKSRLDPAILVCENPYQFSAGESPVASERIEDEDRMNELDEYFKANLNVIGQIDRCFGDMV